MKKKRNRLLSITVVVSILLSMTVMPSVYADYYGYMQSFTGATINGDTNYPTGWANLSGSTRTGEFVTGLYGKAADDSAFKITSTATSGQWADPPVYPNRVLANIKNDSNAFNESETLIDGSYYHLTAEVAACDADFYNIGLYAHRVRVSGTEGNSGDITTFNGPILGFTQSTPGTVTLTAWGEDITPTGFEFKTKTWYTLDVIFNGISNTMDTYLNGEFVKTVSLTTAHIPGASSYTNWHLYYLKYIGLVYDRRYGTATGSAALFDNVGFGNYYYKSITKPAISAPVSDIVVNGSAPSDNTVVISNNTTCGDVAGAAEGTNSIVFIDADGELKDAEDILSETDRMVEIIPITCSATDTSRTYTDNERVFKYYALTYGTPSSTGRTETFESNEISESTNLPQGGDWGSLAGSRTSSIENGKYGLSAGNKFLKIENTTTSGWGTPPVMPAIHQFKSNINVADGDYIYLAATIGARDTNFYSLGLSATRANVEYTDVGGSKATISDIDFSGSPIILGFDNSEGTVKVKSWGQDITPSGFEFNINQMYRIEAIINGYSNTMDAYLNGVKIATVDYSSSFAAMTKSGTAYDFTNAENYSSYYVTQIKRLAITQHKLRSQSSTVCMVDDLAYGVNNKYAGKQVVTAPISDLSSSSLSVSAAAIALNGKKLTGNGIKGYLSTEHSLVFIDSNGDMKSDAATIVEGDRLVESVGDYYIYREVIADGAITVKYVDFNDYSPVPDDGASLNGSTQFPEGFINFGSKCLYMYGTPGLFGKLPSDKVFEIWNVNTRTIGDSGFTRYTNVLWSDAEISASADRNFLISAEIGAKDKYFTNLGITNRFNFDNLGGGSAFSFSKDNGNIVIKSFGQTVSDGTFSFKTNHLYKVDLVYVGNSGLLDIFVDGRKIARRDFSAELSQKGYSSFSKIKYAFIVSDYTDANGELGYTYFDNLTLKYYDGLYPSIGENVADKTKLINVYGFENYEMYSVGDKQIKNGVISEKKDANEDNAIVIAGDASNKYLSYYKKSSDPMIDILVPADGDSIIFDADYTFTSGSGIASMINIIDKNNLGIGLLKYDGSDHTIKALSGTELRTVSEGVTTGTKYQAELVINQTAHTYDVYINGTLCADDFTFDNNFVTLKKFRFTAKGDSAAIGYTVDNWILYEGTERIEKEKYIRNTMFYDDDEVLNYFEDTVAFYLNGNKVFINGEIQTITNPAVADGDDVYVLTDILSSAFGLSVTKNEDVYSVGAATIRGITRNGKNYVLITELCEIASELNYNIDRNGLCLLGSGLNYEDADYLPKNVTLYDVYSRQYLELSNMLIYSRPSVATIKSAYNNLTHPSIICTASDFARIRSEISDDEVKARSYSELVSSADEALSISMPTYTVSGSSLNVHDYAAPMRELALAYQLSGDSKYAQKAYDFMMAYANYKDWHPAHFLDTGVLMGSMAICYDWTYDWMQANVSSSNIQIIENAIIEKGLKESKYAYLGNQYSSWTVDDGNWNAVCNSGVALAAVALHSRLGDETFEYLAYVLRSSEYHLNNFFPDGGFEEGLSYLNYTARHLSYIFGALDTAFGQDFGYFSASAFEKSAYYALCLDGATGGFNYHDAVGGEYIYSQIAWYASKLNDPVLHRIRYEQFKKRPQTGVWDDLIYLDTSYKDDRMELPLDLYYRQTETGMMRSGWSSTWDTYVGYHCGKNTAGHMHYDAGEFVYDYDGIRWAADLGRDDYDLTGYNRTDDCPIYRKRAEGHNVLVLNPDETTGQRTQSNNYVERTGSNANASYAIMNMSEAYDRDAYSARRGVMLSEGRTSLTVRDELVLKDETELYWFMHTSADVTVDGNTATLRKYGRTVKLKFTSNQSANLTLSVMPATQMDSSIRVSGEASNTGYQKIAISGTVSGNFNLTVKIYPQGGSSTIMSTSLNNWTLENDEKPSGDIVVYQEVNDELRPASLEGERIVDFRINNLTNSSQSGDVMGVIYSGNSIYSIFKLPNVSISEQKAISEKIDVDFGEIENPSVKLFYWNSINTLEPLMSAVSK